MNLKNKVNQHQQENSVICLICFCFLHKQRLSPWTHHWMLKCRYSSCDSLNNLQSVLSLSLPSKPQRRRTDSLTVHKSLEPFKLLCKHLLPIACQLMIYILLDLIHRPKTMQVASYQWIPNGQSPSCRISLAEGRSDWMVTENHLPTISSVSNTMYKIAH